MRRANRRTPSIRRYDVKTMGITCDFSHLFLWLDDSSRLSRYRRVLVKLLRTAEVATRRGGLPLARRDYLAVLCDPGNQRALAATRTTSAGAVEQEVAH